MLFIDCANIFMISSYMYITNRYVTARKNADKRDIIRLFPAIYF